MSKSGLIECSRRALVLGALTLGLIAIGFWGWLIAGLLIAAAFILYVFMPGMAPPPRALRYERMPAITGPDLIGFALTSMFIALPFWARAGDSMWDDFGIMVHPAALLTWPMALVCLILLTLAARNASFWVVIEPHGLNLCSVRKAQFVAFDQITQITPYRRGLPKWLNWLTPLLVLTGKFNAAGAIMLARGATGISMQLKNGSAFSVSRDAFEKPLRQILETLHAHGVPFDPGLEKWLPKSKGS